MSMGTSIGSVPVARAIWIVLPFLLLASAAAPADGVAVTGRAAVPAVDYYNMMGFEGIPTLGSGGFVNGQPPPAGDWVSTHCRYIDVTNTGVGDYYLRYPIHLPDAAKITGVSLYVADFNPTGVLWAYLRDRPWASREEPTTRGLALTDNSTEQDRLIGMSPNLDVDNSTKSYWIDVSPTNGTFPGELCVYGIQVSYDCSLCILFADDFESGDVDAWGSAVP